MRAPRPDVVPRLRGRKGMRFRQRFRSHHPLCVDCQAKGRVALAEHLHHVIPLAQGGTHDPENLEGLCVACHLRRHGQRPRKQRLDASGWPIDDD